MSLTKRTQGTAMNDGTGELPFDVRVAVGRFVDARSLHALATASRAWVAPCAAVRTERLERLVAATLADPTRRAAAALAWFATHGCLYVEDSAFAHLEAISNSRLTREHLISGAPERPGDGRRFAQRRRRLTTDYEFGSELLRTQPPGFFGPSTLPPRLCGMEGWGEDCAHRTAQPPRDCGGCVHVAWRWGGQSYVGDFYRGGHPVPEHEDALVPRVRCHRLLVEELASDRSRSLCLRCPWWAWLGRGIDCADSLRARVAARGEIDATDRNEPHVDMWFGERCRRPLTPLAAAQRRGAYADELAPAFAERGESFRGEWRLLAAFARAVIGATRSALECDHAPERVDLPDERKMLREQLAAIAASLDAPASASDERRAAAALVALGDCEGLRLLPFGCAGDESCPVNRDLADDDLASDLGTGFLAHGARYRDAVRAFAAALPDEPMRACVRWLHDLRAQTVNAT